ncbi:MULTISPECIES: hypothetical protein [unclassified Arenibacter]|jgi:hypothetical protein|uniref:hypothetical protein n=1 Tax=unclassified Arenibacter TaxID=2615047 RepID=UPI000E349FCE|nr:MULTISPECIES: hypothetical protein [unclassified Arenibacter]MCM4164427.1 hypothetical protein [Arenibacter sp. A80]RFT56200.1 hypothetical protein D0S24_12550 [Arenibacter sp. P308M17]
MNWRSYLFHFYLDASIHVAFSVFAFIEITCIFFGLSRDNHISYLAFFGTIACYNFVKYGVEAKKYYLVSNRYHKNIQVLSFIAGAFALYHSFFVSFEAWIGIVVLSVLASLYAVPLLPNAKNLRSLGGFKIFIVALVWAGTTVVLPVVAADAVLDWDVVVELVQRFLMVLILMLPFEIRDLAYDDPELRTLPQRFGCQKTKLLGAAGAVLFFLITFMKDQLTYLEVMGKSLVFLVLGVLLLVTKRNQSSFFSSFWVESVPILWWACILVMDAFLNL